MELDGTTQSNKGNASKLSFASHFLSNQTQKQKIQKMINWELN